MDKPDQMESRGRTSRSTAFRILRPLCRLVRQSSAGRVARRSLATNHHDPLADLADPHEATAEHAAHAPARLGRGYPNVWLGVTAENQREADRRLPLLCRTPAVCRFVSAEPLLGMINLAPWLGPVSWVIAGCESAPGKRPGKRPTDLAWIRSLRDQCQAADISFWLKQLVVDGMVSELPQLDGQRWSERPEGRP
jgi:Protein of unknown function (DUF5131)